MPLPLLEENGFGFKAEDVLSRITPKTRLIIVNSPANPTGRVLTLADVLEPGKDGEFWQKVQALHADWLKANDLTDPDLTSVWPFIKTDNFALTEQGLTIKYQNYDIGAYAFGQPEFTVPYGQLKGIVKAIYL
mgnify:CR=1 FL=1